MSDDEQLASKTENLSVGEKKMSKKDAKKAAKKAAFDNEVRAMGGKVDGDIQEDPDEREREYSIEFTRIFVQILRSSARKHCILQVSEVESVRVRLSATSSLCPLRPETEQASSRTNSIMNSTSRLVIFLFGTTRSDENIHDEN